MEYPCCGWGGGEGERQAFSRYEEERSVLQKKCRGSSHTLTGHMTTACSSRRVFASFSSWPFPILLFPLQRARSPLDKCFFELPQEPLRATRGGKRYNITKAVMLHISIEALVAWLE